MFHISLESNNLSRSLVIFLTSKSKYLAAGNQHIMASWSVVFIYTKDLVIIKKQEYKECSILAF